MLRKFIRKILKESLVNEISSELADAAFKEEASFLGKNSIALFGDEDRVVIPMDYNVGSYVKIRKEMEKKGYELDFPNGIAKQKVQTKAGEKIRQIKIDKALQKELKNELKKDPSQESYSVRQLLRKDGKALLKKFEREHPILQKLLNDERSQSLFKEYYRSRTYTLEDLISAAWGWEIDYQGNTIKSNAGGSVRSIPGMMEEEDIIAVQKSIDEIGAELKEIGYIENGQDNRGDFIKAYDEYSKIGSGYAIIVSKSPIDILRMSDFQNIQSCHSETGDFFHCAVQESENGGAVAYLVKKDEIEGVSMMKREIFADSSRGISGIKPIARLRLRRLTYNQNEEKGEIIIPELRTYGMKSDEFHSTINKWSHDIQIENFPKNENGEPIFPSKYQLKGGSYSDNQPHNLLNAWAGRKIADHTTVETNQGLEDLIENVADDLRQNYDSIVKWDGEDFSFEMSYEIDGLYEVHEDSEVINEIVYAFEEEIEGRHDMLSVELDVDNGDINVSGFVDCGYDMDAGYMQVLDLQENVSNLEDSVNKFKKWAENLIQEYMSTDGLSEIDLKRTKQTLTKLLQRDLLKAKILDFSVEFEMALGSDFEKSAFAQALKKKHGIIDDLKFDIGRHHVVKDLVKFNHASTEIKTNVEKACFSIDIKIPIPKTMEGVGSMIENLDSFFRYQEELNSISNSVIHEYLGNDQDDDDDY